MRQEIKFKKVVFSELPNDFVLFKQYNISAKQMYQHLLALHSINAAHQSRLRIFLQSLTQWIHFQSGSKQRSKKPKQLKQSHEQFAVATTRGRFHHHIGRSRVELGMHPIL